MARLLLALLTAHASRAALLGVNVGPKRFGSYERVRAFWRRDDSQPLSRRLGRMIKAAPSLERPVYEPTPWARSSKANFFLAYARSRVGELRRKVEPPLTGRFTTCDDPDILVEWAKDEVALALPADAPIVVFLHTITGSAAQTRWLKSYASARGWRACVFVRRGHGAGRLSSPRFDLLGNVADVQVQLDAALLAYPTASFVGMVGVSAGSGLLISHLGRAGAATPVGAACAICPAWNTSAAFEQLGAAEPLAERAMVKQVQRRFVRRNLRLLRGWDAQAAEACLAATTLPELLAAHAPFALGEKGASGADYLAAHDPMSDRRGVSVPMLLLNAHDDFVCPAALARPDVVVEEQPGTLLLLTRSGSHVAFNEGRWGSGSFHLRLSVDFLDAARATADTDSAHDGASANGALPRRLDGVVVPTRRAAPRPAAAPVTAPTQ